jgi:hypothetical protein
LDQRRAQRYALRLPIAVRQIGSSEIEQSGETLDISSSSLVFRSPGDLTPGERVEFVITLLSTPALVRLCCIGKVLRSSFRGDADRHFDVALSIDRYQFERVAALSAVPAIA